MAPAARTGRPFVEPSAVAPLAGPGTEVASECGVHRKRKTGPNDVPVVVSLASAGESGCATVAVPPAGIRLDEVERALIHFALASTHGNRTRAARFLGLSRSALLYRVQKYGLETLPVCRDDP